MFLINLFSALTALNTGDSLPIVTSTPCFRSHIFNLLIWYQKTLQKTKPAMTNPASSQKREPMNCPTEMELFLTLRMALDVVKLISLIIIIEWRRR